MKTLIGVAILLVTHCIVLCLGFIMGLVATEVKKEDKSHERQGIPESGNAHE